jgi:hypothetical protein
MVTLKHCILAPSGLSMYSLCLEVCLKLTLMMFPSSKGYLWLSLWRIGIHFGRGCLTTKVVLVHGSDGLPMLRSGVTLTLSFYGCRVCCVVI